MIERELDVPRSKIEKIFREHNIKKKTMSEIQSSPLIRKSIESTCLLKYGVKAGFADVKKRNETKKKRYGDENYCNIEKAKLTNFNKHGKTTYLTTPSCRKALLEKYGVDNNIFQSEAIKTKSKQTKKKRYGDENYNNTKKYRETSLKNYGVDNPSKSEKIKRKKIETSLNKYGVEYPWQLDEIKRSVIQIMINKYGVNNGFLMDICIQRAKEKMNNLYGCEHGFQNHEIRRAALRNNYRIKKYIFKSGRIALVMGYENYMLDQLISDGVDENDILTNLECPTIFWRDDEGKEHRHIPDIFIVSRNEILEIKSEYTASEKFIKTILLKKKYAEMAGYVYKIYVINKKTKKIDHEIS